MLAKPSVRQWSGRCVTLAPTAATVPEQSEPGGPGSPGYSPSTLSTSRKFSPTAYTLRLASPVRRCPPTIEGKGSRTRPAIVPRWCRPKRSPEPDMWSGAATSRGTRRCTPRQEYSTSIIGVLVMHSADASDDDAACPEREPATSRQRMAAAGHSCRQERARPHDPALKADGKHATLGARHAPEVIISSSGVDAGGVRDISCTTLSASSTAAKGHSPPLPRGGVIDKTSSAPRPAAATEAGSTLL